MQGFRLVTSPAANNNGTATNGRCWSASDKPVCNMTMVTTGGIITSLGLVSRTALLAGATGLVGSHVLNLLLGDPQWTRVVTVGRRTTARQHAKLEQRVLDLDRKSTRLNSSHSQISYAVFCLKKKQISHQRSATTQR